MRIIVYAICKDEEKNVDLWYDSMKEADAIYVLDTGSTDKTIELLQEKPNVIVKQQIITPWRFDTARNESLEMVPHDVDVCVCTDLDERFTPGWRQEIEKVWTKSTTRGRYVYNWSFNDDGTPGVSFILDKIHSRHGYSWIHQVHEVLTNEIEEVSVEIPIVLNHYQDREKSREMYLEILERSVRENPNDSRDVYCLAREYKAHYMYDKAIEQFHNYLQLETSTWDQERSTTMRLMADCYKNKNYYEEAIMWLNLSIVETPTIREPYYELGALYHDIGDYENARNYLQQALKITKKNTDYINEETSWNGSIYDLLAISEFFTGNYEAAYENAKIAAHIFPNDERITSNLELIENAYKENK